MGWFLLVISFVFASILGVYGSLISFTRSTPKKTLYLTSISFVFKYSIWLSFVKREKSNGNSTNFFFKKVRKLMRIYIFYVFVFVGKSTIIWTRSIEYYKAKQIGRIFTLTNYKNEEDWKYFTLNLLVRYP